MLLEVDLTSVVTRRRQVLHDVRFAIEEPTAVLLGGANGAGKSTLLRVLATLQPCQGVVTVGGSAASGSSASGSSVRRARHAISYLPQDPEFPGSFTVTDLLRYQAYLGEVAVEDVAARMERVLGHLELEPLASRRLKELSGGERRLAHLAGCLLGEPQVLLLDEPSAGLDAHHRVLLRRVLRRLASELVVIVATHAPDDYELLAERVIYLAAGTVAFDGARAEFLELGGGEAAGASTELASTAERAIAAIEGAAAAAAGASLAEQAR